MRNNMLLSLPSTFTAMNIEQHHKKITPIFMPLSLFSPQITVGLYGRVGAGAGTRATYKFLPGAGAANKFILLRNTGCITFLKVS
jgi:hypothetical protein